MGSEVQKAEVVTQSSLALLQASLGERAQQASGLKPPVGGCCPWYCPGELGLEEGTEENV